MIRCTKCNGLPSENDVIVWKCNSCEKAFKVTKSQLKDILMKKDTNPKKTYVKCPSCNNILDNDNENIVWKCSCGNMNKGILKDFKEEEESLFKSNLVKCPECGMEVSKKAKRCVHCGKEFLENQLETKRCIDCGKEVRIDAAECPFCGCPLEREKSAYCNDTIGSKKLKNVIVPAVIVAIIAIIAGVVINFIGKSLNEDEQLAFQNATKMQSMMKDPDSFRLYDSMFLLKHHDESGKVDYIYTIFKYGGANGYGAITTDEAIFKDGRYIMDYADEPDEDDPNYREELEVKIDLAAYMLSGDSDAWEIVDIDIEKIKKKMGLE